MNKPIIFMPFFAFSILIPEASKTTENGKTEVRSIPMYRNWQKPLLSLMPQSKQSYSQVAVAVNPTCWVTFYKTTMCEWLQSEGPIACFFTLAQYLVNGLLYKCPTCVFSTSLSTRFPPVRPLFANHIWLSRLGLGNQVGSTIESQFSNFFKSSN